MSVSLYDLLDVDEGATAVQIRAAWKVAIADLDPSDRRFRAYNDAAAVLLDEEKRAAYDAELAAERDETGEPALVVTDGPAPVVAGAPAPVVADEPSAPVVTEKTPADDASGRTDDAEDAAAVPGGPPVWALLVAAGAAVLALALAIVVLSWPGSLGGTSPADQEERAKDAETAGTTAEAAAADAVPVVLSYDYRTLDEDFANAEAYLTDDFAAKRTALFDEKSDSGTTLRDQVVSDKVVVTAAVSGTGLTRVSEEGDRATVVVFVSQDSQKGNATPRSLRMWATLSMVADGDHWLLDDICTEDDCG